MRTVLSFLFFILVYNVSYGNSPVPFNLSAEYQENSKSIFLSFECSSEVQIVKFEIYRGTDALSLLNETEDHSYTDSFELVYGTTYKYSVKSVDIDGNISEFSNIAEVIVPHEKFGKIDGFFLIPGDQIIDITWSKIESLSFYSYKIYFDTAEFTDISDKKPIVEIKNANENCWRIYDVLNGHPYFVAVTAVNKDGIEENEVDCKKGIPLTIGEIEPNDSFEFAGEITNNPLIGYTDIIGDEDYYFFDSDFDGMIHFNLHSDSSLFHHYAEIFSEDDHVYPVSYFFEYDGDDFDFFASIEKDKRYYVRVSDDEGMHSGAYRIGFDTYEASVNTSFDSAIKIKSGTQELSGNLYPKGVRHYYYYDFPNKSCYIDFRFTQGVSVYGNWANFTIYDKNYNLVKNYEHYGTGYFFPEGRYYFVINSPNDELMLESYSIKFTMLNDINEPNDNFDEATLVNFPDNCEFEGYLYNHPDIGEGNDYFKFENTKASLLKVYFSGNQQHLLKRFILYKPDFSEDYNDTGTQLSKAFYLTDIGTYYFVVKSSTWSPIDIPYQINFTWLENDLNEPNNTFDEAFSLVFDESGFVRAKGNFAPKNESDYFVISVKAGDTVKINGEFFLEYPYAYYLELFDQNKKQLFSQRGRDNNPLKCTYTSPTDQKLFICVRECWHYMLSLGHYFLNVELQSAEAK